MVIAHRTFQIQLVRLIIYFSVFAALLPAVGIFALFVWSGDETFREGQTIAVSLLIVAVLFVAWFPQAYARRLRYGLEGTTLRIDQGIVFRKRKSIPLDRVTDVVMSQGPLMRCLGIWVLQIQTPGRGQPLPEGTFYALVDPERIRNEIMDARDQAARSGQAFP